MPAGNPALAAAVGTVPVGVGVTVLESCSAAVGTGVGASSTASPPQLLASKVDTSAAATIAATRAVLIHRTIAGPLGAQRRAAGAVSQTTTGLDYLLRV